MDALDVMKVCLRRWYVMLTIVLVAGGAAVGLLRQQEPVYTAFGNYAVVYTHGEDIVPNQIDPRGANPLAGDNATLLAEALVDDLMSTTRQRAQASAGTRGYAPGDPPNGTSYSATLPEASQSYLVQAWGPDPKAVREVVSAVLDSTPAHARTIQDRAGAPKSSQYTTFTTSPVQVKQLPPPSKVKLLAALGAIGLLAGAALSILVDRLASRRRPRAADGEASDEAEIERTASTPMVAEWDPPAGPGTKRGNRPLHDVQADEEESRPAQVEPRSPWLQRVR